MALSLEQVNKMQTEWADWHDLVQRLKDCGAVTQEDCNSPQDANETPGQQLFQAIRRWGESLVDLRGGERAPV